MNWKKHFKDWKLALALALIFALCGHATPHVESQFYNDVPNTISTVQVSGTNVSAGVYSFGSQQSSPMTNLAQSHLPFFKMRYEVQP